MTALIVPTMVLALIIPTMVLALMTPTVMTAQDVPLLGTVQWYNSGYDSVAKRNNHTQSIDHAVAAGQLIIASDANWDGTTSRVTGELMALDVNTGQILRSDSVCPYDVTNGGAGQTILSATINDSGTVVCYMCAADGVHLATYPALEPIADTLVTSSLRAWLSNTGRYMVLVRRVPGDRYAWCFAYDRQTGDTVRMSFGVGVPYSYGPYFSSDDRYVVMTKGESGKTRRLPFVFDLQTMRVLHDGIPIAYETYDPALSYRGNRIMSMTDCGAIVFDAVTGERVWSAGVKTCDVSGGFISADGTEVYLVAGRELIDSTATTGLWMYRYRLPETVPSGVIKYRPQDMIGWSQAWLFPQPTVQGMFVAFNVRSTGVGRMSHGPVSSVPQQPDPFMPILYPNPASSIVTMSVADCADRSWVVSLHDTRGRELWQRTVTCEGGTLRFDVSATPAGTYVVQASTPMGTPTASAMLIVK
jgi:outer membrane protein assembly factor BamB